MADGGSGKARIQALGWALVPMVSGWIGGTAVHLQLGRLPSPGVLAVWAAAGAVLALFAASGGMLPKHPMRRFLVWMAAACLAFSACGWRSAEFMSHSLDMSLEGIDIRVTGEIVAMPQRQPDGTRFRFDVMHAQANGAAVTLPPRIYLGWYAGFGDAQSGVPNLLAGDCWSFTVRLKAPHGNVNPHGFDYELWMWEQDLQATGSVRAASGTAAPQLLWHSWAFPVERARQTVRDAIFAAVADRRSAGVVAALVTGDQGAIERADWDVFRATGVAHLMSISGLHVTMFAWLAAALVGLLWRRSRRLCLAWPAQTAGLVCGVALAAGYAVFSGWGVPSQRTVWMLAVAALLKVSARRWPWPVVWLLTCAVVVAVDPWAMLQAGFWLSFVAVGVLFASDGAGRAVQEAQTQEQQQPETQTPPWHRRAGSAALDHLTSMLREQWTVTLALAPLTLLLFQQISLVGLVSNFIAIPWVTLVVTPLSMAGILVAPVWQGAAWSVQALAWVLDGMSRWPMASVSMAAPPMWTGMAGVAGGVLLIVRLPLAMKALAVPLALPLLLWQPPRPVPGEVELLAADIGQGNAVIVRTATHTLVYDTGPRFSRDSDAGHRTLVPLLRAMGESVDRVMLSHRDSDHTGGARAVLEMQPQADLLSSIEDAHELQSVRHSTRCIAGQSWEWDGVRFDVLHPLPKDYEGTPAPNAISCVLKIQARGGAALLAGDIEQPQEAALVARGPDLHADVLLVPHHGSKTSSSEAFLRAVSPRLAVVQAGYRNRFGHPAPPVMARYASAGIQVVQNVHCGAVVWSSEKPAVAQCQRKHEQHYWRNEAPV